MSHKVHIILLNYANPSDTIECLESLKGIDYSNIEIIIVEICNLNNSLNELNKFLSSYSLSTTLLELNVNNGFAYANNHAIKYILTQKDKYFIWILNNDTIVKKESLQYLKKFYNNNINTKKIGFLGSKILEYSNPNIIQTVGGTFNPKTGFSKLIGKGEIDNRQYNEPFITDYVIGASMFFHVDLISQIGLMPEDYFLYYEDIDWCMTAKKQDFLNFTVPQSVVIHKQGASTGNKYNKKKTTSPTRKYMYSSYIKFYKKFYPK
ncbi:MAG: glycosyltransferase family 2 protein, partial [Bacteroidales bacterium]|nr:glycosyltransferase family 2 protein [Bacteroidales bacterium]